MNGHVITEAAEDFPEHREDFCTECGAQTIMQCQECLVPIRGNLRNSGVIGIFERRAPRFCHACGHPYPWTVGALDAARELALEAENLTDDEREQLAASLEDLVRDSPKTEIAAGRFKRLVRKAGAETATALRSVMIAVATETAKKSIWGP